MPAGRLPRPRLYRDRCLLHDHPRLRRPNRRRLGATDRHDTVFGWPRRARAPT